MRPQLRRGKKLAVANNQTWNLGISHQWSATELQQPRNHQPLQSSISICSFHPDHDNCEKYLLVLSASMKIAANIHAWLLT